MNQRLLMAATFLAGMLAGALVLAAAERHLLGTTTTPALPDTQVEPVATPEVIIANTDTTASDSPAADGRWRQVDQALEQLQARVATLEDQLSGLAATGTEAAAQPPIRDSDAGLSQATLEAAGLDPVQAAEILQRQSRRDMQRLELRDQASREGWAGTERFFEAMRELNGDAASLRVEIGDEAYDRFLYLTGQPNRVVIDSVITESPAQLAGLQPGDVVLDYAVGRIFSWVVMRDASRVGQRGEYIVMRVQRDGRPFEVNVPRGPLGVRMETEQVNPDAGG